MTDASKPEARINRARYRRVVRYFARTLAQVVWWEIILRRVLGQDYVGRSAPRRWKQIAERFQWREHKLLDLGLEKAKASRHALDNAALQLQRMGFRIIRIPCLPNGLNNDMDKNDRVMGVSFNYSNVLAEVYEDVKKVYIPRYGFQEMDEAAAAAYEKAGYEVVFIQGLLTNAVTSRAEGKGLDCLTSEIRFPVRWER